MTFQHIYKNFYRYNKKYNKKFLKHFNLNFFIICYHNFFSQFFFLYIKMNREASAKYYQRNKEKIQKKLRERYQNLTEEGKNKR